MNQTGMLYGVGVGPGDPTLITLKAKNIIENSDVIALPGTDKENVVSYNIAKQVVKDLDKKKCICIDMPMTKDEVKLQAAHEKAADLVKQELDKGFSVAYLTLGDPTIYSTYIYIKEILDKKGYTSEIVNGVTSFCAASSIINDSLTCKSEELHIIPGYADITKIKNYTGSIVIMKPSANYNELKKMISENNYKARLVTNCGMMDEKIYLILNDFPETIGYYSVIIIKK